MDVRGSSPVLHLRVSGDHAVADGAREVLTTLLPGFVAELTLNHRTLSDSQSLVDVLCRYPGHRLIAVVDDSTDVLLNEALRTVRADVLMSGHHVGGVAELSDSRHNLWVASRLASRFTAPEPVNRGPWQHNLGRVLGLVATGRRVPLRLAELARSAGAKLDDTRVRMNSVIAVLRAPNTELKA
jgi:hypothetical protein